MTNANAKEIVKGLMKVYNLYAAPERFILDSLKDKDKFTNQEKEVISHLSIRKPSGGRFPPIHPKLDPEIF